MDLNNLTWWQYGAVIGGAILALGIVLYFLPTRKLKVPGVLTAGVGGMGLGLAVGIIWLAGFGYKPGSPPPRDEGAAPTAPGGAPKMMAKGGGMGKGGGGMGKGKGGGGFGGPPTPRVQLVGLVNALDRLVDHPVTLSLSAEDKAAIAGQLKGLDAAAEIKEDDAKARLDAILKVLEKNRPALEAVGYRWPGPDGKGPPRGGAPKDSPNPFAEGSEKEKLKSLQDRLEKKDK